MASVLDAITNAADHVVSEVKQTADAVVHEPIALLRGAVGIATAASHQLLPDLSIIGNDIKSAAVGAVHVLADLGTGFVDEIKQHPLQLLEDAAIGAAFGALAVVAPEAAVPLGLAMLGEQVIADGRNEDYNPLSISDNARMVAQILNPMQISTNLTAVATCATDLIDGGIRLAHDAQVDSAPQRFSQAEQSKAHSDLKNAGGFLAHAAAGLAGTIGGSCVTDLVNVPEGLQAIKETASGIAGGAQPLQAAHSALTDFRTSFFEEMNDGSAPAAHATPQLASMSESPLEYTTDNLRDPGNIYSAARVLRREGYYRPTGSHN